VKIIEAGIIMGTRRDGGAAQHRRASKRMGAPAQILDLASQAVGTGTSRAYWSSRAGTVRTVLVH
jgi:hypothetical protein